jgi:AcrR family transcriptional regulator
MSKRVIEDADKRILRATIKLGGSSNPNKDFSTRNIAKESGVSEFLIFSRYKNKTNLMQEADSYCYTLLRSGAKTIANNVIKVPDFINAFLDWLLAHPELVYFTLNYGHGIPHVEEIPLKDEKAYLQKRMEDADYFFNHFKSKGPYTYLVMWDYLLKTLLYCAGSLLAHEYIDSPEYREHLCALVDKGLGSLHEKEAPIHG